MLFVGITLITLWVYMSHNSNYKSRDRRNLSLDINQNQFPLQFLIKVSNINAL